MLRCLLLPLLFLAFHAEAQTPTACNLMVPGTLNAFSQWTQALCMCTITDCEVKLFNQRGAEIWGANTLSDFPTVLLSQKQFQSGTYFWHVKYTAIRDSAAVKLETRGSIEVIKP